LSSSNIELVDIQYHKKNKEQVLRIFIDSEDGVSLELCSDATRLVKDIIDGKNIYYDHLEVSSPGLDRVLKRDKDFKRFIGHKIKIKTLKAYAGPRKILGILKDFNIHSIIVELDNDTMIIPRSMITVVKLDPEL
jgi:ribosome maturation factor RimP